MRFTRRFVAFALAACCLAANRTYAADTPYAHIEGYKCERVVVDGPPGLPESTVLVCWIGDDINPLSTIHPLSTESIGTLVILDSLVQLLPFLNHTLHDFIQPQRATNTTPPPTP